MAVKYRENDRRIKTKTYSISVAAISPKLLHYIESWSTAGRKTSPDINVDVKSNRRCLKNVDIG